MTPKERSNGRCEAEVLQWIQCDGYMKWAQCAHKGTCKAHIWTRRHCGKVKEHHDVVIWSCEEHNLNQMDGRFGMRAPLERAQAAWDVIMANAKDKISTRNMLGKRPEKGTAPYVHTE